MDNYKYITKDCEIRLMIKIHNYFAGLIGRKALLKEFCINNGIDYMPKVGQKYKLPPEYLFEHDEMKYMAGIRDKIILNFYETYKDIQTRVLQEIQNCKSNIGIQIDILETDKEVLQKKRLNLKNAKDPQLKITLQNIVEVAKTKVENDKREISRMKQEQEKYLSILANNIENWGKQIDIINAAFSIQKNRFEKNAAKRIAKYLNYTEVCAILPEYSESVEKIIKGEIHENTQK